MSHAVSTRHGGLSRAPYSTLNLGYSTGDDVETVLANRETFLRSVGGSRLSTGRLTHGRDVAVFEGDGRGFDSTFAADAAISNVPDRHLLVTCADCVPIALADTKLGVVGLAHAGWRGTALGIGPAVVKALRQAFGSDPADLVAGIGPGIGACCYRVGTEVIESFRDNGYQAVCSERDGGCYLDLQSTNRLQLIQAGLRSGGIETIDVCTSCHTEDFYSHRAEGRATGRFGLCISA
ncbi:MAG: peptidoglycan editing factor PgeF [Chloroflexota bacterium]